MNALYRNMKVHVAATKEDGRVLKRALRAPNSARRSDEATAKGKDGTESPRIPNRVLAGEASSLRKAGNGDLFSRQSGFPYDPFDAPQSGGKVRLVSLDGLQKRVRIPGAFGGLRSEERKAFGADPIGQLQDRLRRGSTPVQED
jgi:hypothetical protein